MSAREGTSLAWDIWDINHSSPQAPASVLPTSRLWADIWSTESLASAHSWLLSLL